MPDFAHVYRKSRAAELYGFVAWTSTTFLYLVYLLWGLVPDEYILATGIDWYPNREWAILVPAWTVVVILLTYFTYLALARLRTPSFAELTTVVDSRSSFPRISDDGDGFIGHAREDAMPELYDMPIGLVNRVLYHDGGSDL